LSKPDSSTAGGAYALARSLLFRLDAERAHALTLGALDGLQRLHLAHWLAPAVPLLPARAFGLNFPNPVGLAAGLDKNAAHVDGLAALGFGFIEVGTVTPRAQPGNPRPRLFRLSAQQALINRMGFNNGGIDALLRNLDRTQWRGVLGINIGKNKDTPNAQAAGDYLLGLTRVHAHASYITVNISSPNTAGLRDLQARAALDALIGQLREAQERLGAQAGTRKPMLLKIAPDLEERDMDDMAEVLQRHGIDGLICTNTTLARDGVDGTANAQESGGLSGIPLRARADVVLRGMHARLPGMDMIGVGGIGSGAAAAQKRAAGATLVQLYTGLIYCGPSLIHQCVEALRVAAESGDAPHAD
jgi:dihydroorotate dehydrogenase